MEEGGKIKEPIWILSGAMILLGILFLLIILHLAGQRQIIEDVDLERAYELMETHRDDDRFVLLDIRTPEEFEIEHIRGANNLDFYSDTFRRDLDKLDKKKTYLVYCRQGERTQKAVPIFHDLGFKRVYVMFEGLKEWIAYGFPTTQQG